MKLSTFKLFKNTNFVDMQNTLHFNSNEERDSWFDSYFTETIEFTNPFNFRYDRGTLRVPMGMNELQGYNYCRFIDGFDNKVYYAYIIKTSYLNDKTTQLDLVIDTVMTFTQGSVLENLDNIEVIRQHLPMQEIINREEFLRTNDDTLATTTMRFINPGNYSNAEGGVSFSECVYIIQSAVQLDGDFGTEDKPKMQTAYGSSFDGINSAVNLYLVESDNLEYLLTVLSDYPWITQNFKTIVKVPKLFFDLSSLKKITVKGLEVYWLTERKYSKEITLPFKITRDRIMGVHGLKAHERYLVRDNLINFYLTDYRGNQLNFETGKIGTNNDIIASAVFGAMNQIDIYSNQYGARAGEKGFYRDNQMTISTFDNVPVMIDNYKLNKANTAYQRQLDNSRQLSGRLSTVTSSESSVKDRLFNAISVYSNVFSGGLAGSSAKAVGLFGDEYEYYRNQKAQFNQWKLSPPTISEGSYTNSTLEKTNDWGIWLKVSTISNSEITMLRRYYGLFGHEAMKGDNKLYNINSMSKANWVQFKGNYWIDDMDRELFDQMKTLFEGGVRLWHSYSDLANRSNMEDNNVKG